MSFANALLETEISQRNARKDAQENTARGVIITAGLVLTLLLGLANDAGLFSAGTSILARIGSARARRRARLARSGPGRMTGWGRAA